MDDNFNVQYIGQKYDIREFLKNHPGGVNYVQAYEEKDVTRKMEDMRHSKAAFYLLREYKIGGRDLKKNQHTQDLEDLVDWNKPMLRQVVNLGEKYYEWVNSPVDRHMTLFGNTILESLTITPWYVVPLIWIPVSFYIIYLGSIKQLETSYNVLNIVGLVALGILLWTLLEYSLHRWVFHIIPSGKSKLVIYFHFTIHGLHHKVPFDSRRLVFPPFPAALIVTLGYYFYWSTFPENMYELVGGGTILGNESCLLEMVLTIITGYVMYDMVHFYIHHGNPKEGSYLYVMKRYHNHHHFSEHEAGFGISSQLWDFAFGTVIRLKKLAMAIRW